MDILFKISNIFLTFVKDEFPNRKMKLISSKMACPSWRDSVRRYARNSLTSNIVTYAANISNTVSSHARTAVNNVATSVVNRYCGSGAGSSRQAANK